MAPLIRIGGHCSQDSGIIRNGYGKRGLIKALQGTSLHFWWNHVTCEDHDARTIPVLAATLGGD